MKQTPVILPEDLDVIESALRFYSQDLTKELESDPKPPSVETIIQHQIERAERL